MCLEFESGLNAFQTNEMWQLNDSINLASIIRLYKNPLKEMF